MKLFVYGTLQVPNVIRRLISRVPCGEPAVLCQSKQKMYERFALKRETYPVLLETEKRVDVDSIDGVLYHDLTGDEIRVLDEFEGEEYSRELVDVMTKEDKRTTAYTYLFPNASVQKYADEIDFQRTSKLSDFDKPRVVDQFIKDVVANGVLWD